MPVIQKDDKYELTFKNLRHREIPCLVIAVPQKIKVPLDSETHSDSGTYNNQDVKQQDMTNSKVLKRLKQRSNQISKTPRKKLKSLPCLDKKSDLPCKVTKKTVNRRRSLETELEPQKKTPDVLDSTSDVSSIAPVVSSETSKKRAYCKKSLQVATIKKISGSPVSASTVKLCFGTPVITPETPKKRVYRKKLKIPAVPNNTPVLCLGSNGNSITSTSFLSQSNARHSDVVTIVKRGRGRPRLSFPTMRLGSDNSEDTSQGSEKSNVNRRARRSLWAFDGEEQVEDQVSEYELLRQRNIEENLKKLREIFTQQGLEFEEKSSESSETPKKRKCYSRLPLPPPRPRSQRIEIRRTFMPLDFTKLDEKLTMSEAAFM